MLLRQHFICSGIEVVITSTTGNRVAVKSGTRVQIPPTAPKKFRNLWISELFCAFCGTLESAEKVVHNATITAVKKVRKLGFEKVTFCNFFGERFCTHAEFLWPVAP